MNQEWSLKQKDSLLQELLQHLSARGVAVKWATSKTPYSDVQRECRTLMEDQNFTIDISRLKARKMMKMGQVSRSQVGLCDPIVHRQIEQIKAAAEPVM